MKVNSLRITKDDLAKLRQAFGMFETRPEFITRLENTMEYQQATVLHYTLDSIEFEQTESESHAR